MTYIKLDHLFRFLYFFHGYTPLGLDVYSKCACLIMCVLRTKKRLDIRCYKRLMPSAFHHAMSSFFYLPFSFLQFSYFNPLFISPLIRGESILSP